MRFRVLATLLVFSAGSTVALVTERAKAPQPKPKQKEKEKEEEVLTFTTADLERKYGKSKKTKPQQQPEPGAKPQTKADKAKPDPLSQLQASQEAKREKAAQRAAAQERVQAAQEKVADLEKRLASLRNPLLGRPQPTDEEKEAWKGNDQAGRLRITEENLAAARGELSDALTALEELR